MPVNRRLSWPVGRPVRESSSNGGLLMHLMYAFELLLSPSSERQSHTKEARISTSVRTMHYGKKDIGGQFPTPTDAGVPLSPMSTNLRMLVEVIQFWLIVGLLLVAHPIGT